MDSQTFRNPPQAYREIPFWSWNDRLDPDELRRQIRLMREGGWGGFFMHSRVGLRTPYLGPDWLACVRAAVDEARSCGLQAWLYDEDKWPSGYAGGASITGNPEHRAQRLVCKIDARPNLVAERIATFRAREAGGVLQDICPDPAPRLTHEDDRLIQFYPAVMALGNQIFNDYTYVDLLNADAVAAFLDATHAIYAAEIGDEFGRTVPGIFTDEPCFQFHHYTYGEFGYQADDPAVPWTGDLPAFFQATNGYDLLSHLPSLFFDAGDYLRVRYDFYRTVTRMFLERFTKQVYRWCEEHGLQFTGHFMGEDTLLWQIPWVGAVMPHLAFMHIPGIDKLGRSVNDFDAGMVLTLKQLDSIACQTGKRRSLCENYGCSGQDFSHAGRKWIGDWSYVLGVNMNNPHMALYSMAGERKRDCPPTLFFQQPWWSENRLVADYFARLSYALSQGQRQVDILVIHPVASAWTLFRPGASTEVIQLDRALNDLLLCLMGSQRDFHLADEMLMEHGEPCEARVSVDADGPCLIVGKAAYRVIIVPPAVTLSSNTVALLSEFAAAGGSILALQPLPARVDGALAGQVLPTGTRIISSATLPAALDQCLPFAVRVAEHGQPQPSIWAHHRKVDDAEIYFLANIDPERATHAVVQLRCTGRVEAWDPATGAVSHLPTRSGGGITEVALLFLPAGSHLLIVHPDQAPLDGEPAASAEPANPAQHGMISLGNGWHIGSCSPNALVLDTARIQLEGMDWSMPMHILDAHRVAARAGHGARFRLRFEFQLDETLGVPVALVMERPGQFRTWVNGHEIDRERDEGWWIDPAFRKRDVTPAIVPGANDVLLSGIVTRATELEAIYFTGAFGVTSRWLRRENQLTGQVFDRYAPEFALRPLPAAAGEMGPHHPLRHDMTAGGFPFFAGRMNLAQQIDLPFIAPNLQLEIEGLRAALANVRVNGRPAGTTAWPPHRVPMAVLARPGRNEIEIELVGTLRNLLGPHHLAGGDPKRTNPEEFRDKTRWTDDYLLTPFGWERVRLCW